MVIKIRFCSDALFLGRECDSGFSTV